MPERREPALLPRVLWRSPLRSGAEVRSIIEDVLREAGLSAREIAQVRIDASMVGADITALDISAQRATFRVPLAACEAAVTAPPGDVIIVPASVGRFSLVLDRVTIARVPLSVRATVTEVPLRWLEVDGLVVGVDDGGAWHGSASIRVDTELDKMTRLLREVANRGSDVAVTKLKVSGTSQTDRSADVRITAGIRKGIIGASATATAHVEIDNTLAATVSQLTLRSRNPIVAIALRVLRRRIRGAVEGTHALAEAAGPGVEITDVRMRFGSTLVGEISLRGTGVIA